MTLSCTVAKSRFILISAFQQVSKIFKNKPKSIKKSLLMHPLRVFFVEFLHIHTLHLTTFIKKFKKNVEKIKKR